MNRKEAQAAGGKVYSGKSCKRGHSGIRYTSNWACVECHKESSLAYARDPKNKETLAVQRKRHYEKHREEIRAKQNAVALTKRINDARPKENKRRL